MLRGVTAERPDPGRSRWREGSSLRARRVWVRRGRTAPSPHRTRTGFPRARGERPATAIGARPRGRGRIAIPLDSFDWSLSTSRFKGRVVVLAPDFDDAVLPTSSRRVRRPCLDPHGTRRGSASRGGRGRFVPGVRSCRDFQRPFAKQFGNSGPAVRLCPIPEARGSISSPDLALPVELEGSTVGACLLAEAPRGLLVPGRWLTRPGAAGRARGRSAGDWRRSGRTSRRATETGAGQSARGGGNDR